MVDESVDDALHYKPGVGLPSRESRNSAKTSIAGDHSKYDLRYIPKPIYRYLYY